MRVRNRVRTGERRIRQRRERVVIVRVRIAQEQRSLSVPAFQLRDLRRPLLIYVPVFVLPVEHAIRRLLRQLPQAVVRIRHRRLEAVDRCRHLDLLQRVVRRVVCILLPERPAAERPVLFIPQNYTIKHNTEKTLHTDVQAARFPEL